MHFSRPGAALECGAKAERLTSAVILERQRMS
jgi:hypothetical protein